MKFFMLTNKELVRMILKENGSEPMLLGGKDKVSDITEFVNNYHLVNHDLFKMLYPDVPLESLQICLMDLTVRREAYPNSSLWVSDWTVRNINR